jgi:hypothetical protein
MRRRYRPGESSTLARSQLRVTLEGAPGLSAGAGKRRGGSTTMYGTDLGRWLRRQALADGPSTGQNLAIARFLRARMWRLRWRVGTVAVLAAALGAASCSSLNREGPLVTCANLQGGTINACQGGIIASCRDGKTVTYEVCTDGDKPDQICSQTWQTEGAYQCTQRAGGTGSSGGSSGSSASGGSGSIASGSSAGSGVASPSPCLPTSGSSCDQCLSNMCFATYDACMQDTACSEQCAGPKHSALIQCAQGYCLPNQISPATCATNSTGGLQ